MVVEGRNGAWVWVEAFLLSERLDLFNILRDLCGKCFF